MQMIAHVAYQLADGNCGVISRNSKMGVGIREEEISAMKGNRWNVHIGTVL